MPKKNSMIIYKLLFAFRVQLPFFLLLVVGNSSFSQTQISEANGNVGIGTTTPASKLEVKGADLGNTAGGRSDILNLAGAVGYNNSALNVYNYRHTTGPSWTSASTRIQQRIDGENMGYIEFNPPGMTWGMALGTSNLNRLFIHPNGKVGIGTPANFGDGDFLLYVETGIRTRNVKVDIKNWADYVFLPSYKLLSLKELEQYIATHRHLPDIKSAEEVKENGLDLGENQAALLKKIEELTLYAIDQNKRIEALEAALINGKSLKSK